MRRITLRYILTTIGLSLCCIFIAFVFINYSGNTSEKTSQSVKCDCSSKQEAVLKTIPSVSVDAPNTARSRTCIEVQKSSPVQRAIVIFYPHHQSEYFFPEVRW